jgi:hypothetical protein
LESFMTAMISGISLPKASGAQRRAFPAILSPKHLAAAARLAAEMKIHHMPELDSWAVEGCELGWTAAGTSDWGTDCRHAGKLHADALNSRAPQIFDTIKDGGSERRVLKVVDAETAKTKLQKNKDEFQRWIWPDPDRTDPLARRFNNSAPRAFDVIFITLEDETGIAHLAIWPKVFESNRRSILSASMIAERGRIQRESEVVHLVAQRICGSVWGEFASVGERETSFPCATAAAIRSAPGVRARSTRAAVESDMHARYLCARSSHRHHQGGDAGFPLDTASNDKRFHS